MSKEQRRSTRSMVGTRCSSPSPSSVPSTSSSSAREHQLPLANLNPYITCPLCGGYFVDATTIIECLHTFCKSCLLHYFDEEHTDCPKCHFQIHQSHPSHYVSFDRTMQDIVYKLVPEMQVEETERRELFNREHANGQVNGVDAPEEGLVGSREGKNAHRKGGAVKKSTPSSEPKTVAESNNPGCCSGTNHRAVHRRSDEPVFIQLLPGGDDLQPMERQYVRLSGFATVNTVKRLLAYMLRGGDITKYGSYDLFCRNELMGRDYSMAFIHKTRWRDRPPDEPLTLTYKEHVEF